MNQITNTIMMIRPKNFGYNKETAENNAFQSKEGSENVEEIRNSAIEEFDLFVEKLRVKGVVVVVIEDSESEKLTDAVFPNNWVSFHEKGWIITYPMFSEIRRKERREDVISFIQEKYGFKKRYSFEYYEEENMFLEGTGSLILDRENKIGYACRSVRTEARILDKWAVLNEYETLIFHAYDKEGMPIYHTNVLMALGKDFAVVCMDSITDEEEQKQLKAFLIRTQKELVNISFEQMEAYAGNMLQIQGNNGPILIMSTQAYNSLSEGQIKKLESYSEILHSDIRTIEKYGGGSVRCMMAEIFYPKM